MAAADNLVVDHGQQFHSHDECPACHEDILIVYKSSEIAVIGGERHRIQRLRCHGCRYLPQRNKVLVPIRFAPGRIRMKRLR